MKSIEISSRSYYQRELKKIDICTNRAILFIISANQRERMRETEGESDRVRDRVRESDKYRVNQIKHDTQ